MLLPSSTSYSLGKLAAQIEAEHSRPHRALDDAQATRMVFLSLLERARTLDSGVLAELQNLATRARWPVARLFVSPRQERQATSLLGMGGVDAAAIHSRLAQPGPSLKQSKVTVPVDPEELTGHLSPGGLLSRTHPAFEWRPQQVEMMRAVSGAINSGHHLIVEGGTGVGKSLAYLLPAILYSFKNGTRVVISTNTINLQEQLLGKDIPALVKALEENGSLPRGQFKCVPLKGRANYLCLRRWSLLARGESLSRDEARLLGKTLVWLQGTATGDRGEINLSGKDASTWGRVSAAEKARCPGMRGEGPCFLRSARDRAEAAHLVVVNHALLLSDLAMGGGVLPDYDHLIVDEAHHLEEEATRQLGFQVSQNGLGEGLEALGRLAAEVQALVRGSGLPEGRRRQAQELADGLEAHWSRQVRDRWDRLWSTAETFLSHHQGEGSDQSQLLVTRSVRAQPGWSDLELAWENLDVVLTDGLKRADRLGTSLEALPADGPLDLESVAAELAGWQDGMLELQARLKTLLVAAADNQRIDWMERAADNGGDSSSRSHIVLHSAPLNVGQDLQERLFSKKRSVVLTSATLSSQGSMEYLRDRVGLRESEDLVVGSPFDYKRAVLLLLPEDIPAPDAPGYQQAAERLVAALARAVRGRTLVLFTSHAALRATARAVRGPLAAEGVRVLAQGVDGSPRQILQEFSESAPAVILGTSSLWEGVDLPGGVLKALVIGRLPFHVPTDPIFAARSGQYEDAFHQYALPQAVLRLRQGVGRLIRSSQDRGAIVVLDRRISSKPYGRAFLESLPPCTVKRAPLASIADYAARWIGDGA
jgi:DNA polymerase-3 subunit epsilon/ATP-dependent DNA helicase DinG